MVHGGTDMDIYVLICPNMPQFNLPHNVQCVCNEYDATNLNGLNGDMVTTSRCTMAACNGAAATMRTTTTLQILLAQHRSCNGDQVCSNCWQCPIPRGSISKAVQVTAGSGNAGESRAEGSGRNKGTRHRRCLGCHRGKKTEERRGGHANARDKAGGKTTERRRKGRNDQCECRGCQHRTKTEKRSGGGQNTRRRTKRKTTQRRDRKRRRKAESLASR